MYAGTTLDATLCNTVRTILGRSRMRREGMRVCLACTCLWAALTRRSGTDLSELKNRRKVASHLRCIILQQKERRRSVCTFHLRFSSSGSCCTGFATFTGQGLPCLRSIPKSRSLSSLSFLPTNPFTLSVSWCCAAVSHLRSLSSLDKRPLRLCSPHLTSRPRIRDAKQLNPCDKCRTT